MSGMKWERANERDRLKDARRRSMTPGNDARAEQAARRRVQDVYRRFVLKHRGEHPFCRDLAERQIDHGRPITKSQASTLRQIAQERGWPLQAAGSRRSGASGPNADRRRAAREAVEQYSGDNRWLHYVQREFLCDPAWLPTEKMTAKITTELASEPTASSDWTELSFDRADEPFPP